MINNFLPPMASAHASDTFKFLTNLIEFVLKRSSLAITIRLPATVTAPMTANTSMNVKPSGELHERKKEYVQQ